MTLDSFPKTYSLRCATASHGVWQYGYHLGTDLAVAMSTAEYIAETYTRYGAITIAMLVFNGKPVDVYSESTWASHVMAYAKESENA